MHPRHMTDGELREAYDDVVFPENPDNLFEDQVVREYVYRFNFSSMNALATAVTLQYEI